MSDSEIPDIQVEEKIKKKRQMTEAQKQARLDNLKKGQAVRAANIAKRKRKQEKQAKTQKYSAEEESSSDSDTDTSDSESSIQEFTISRKTKDKKPVKSKHKSNTSEISELKQMILQLAKNQKKRAPRAKTVINIPSQATPSGVHPEANKYKTRLLEL